PERASLYWLGPSPGVRMPPAPRVGVQIRGIIAETPPTPAHVEGAPRPGLASQVKGFGPKPKLP
ncbi:MAG: hypothetical protein V7604_2832, partial [Hyphomicrobiales bacterium]